MLSGCDTTTPTALGDVCIEHLTRQKVNQLPWSDQLKPTAHQRCGYMDSVGSLRSGSLLLVGLFSHFRGRALAEDPQTGAGLAAARCVHAGQALLLPATQQSHWPAGEEGDSWSKLQQGLFWELSPGPLAPEARVMPLDQTAK